MNDNQKYVSLLKSTFDIFFGTLKKAWEDFADKCEVVSFNKNEVIKTSNSTENYFYFIIKEVLGFLFGKNIILFV